MPYRLPLVSKVRPLVGLAPVVVLSKDETNVIVALDFWGMGAPE